ncbi:disease resistance protein L6-like isoform X2 [Cornus florida]|uniref:disease resistance protein L6-like isoform X2 n=1 Tax=Cornus florida TaxID=4283 RepID=UPI0028A2BBEF|nr:disease resistance protein L6-like isoform X2 [Cornus florida]
MHPLWLPGLITHMKNKKKLAKRKRDRGVMKVVFKNKKKKETRDTSSLPSSNTYLGDYSNSNITATHHCISLSSRTFEMDTQNKKRKITKNTSLPPSNTCSSSTSPPAAAGCDYEVFLSFRGSDTRDNFTDTLYHGLVDAGIRTFRDNEELHAGEKIAELFKAIQHSKISIPVFSKAYASSKWCLKEIAKMVECRRTFGQLILPIFFGVKTSDLKYQTGSYGEAFQKHEENWKEALKEAENLKEQEVKKVADVDPSDVRHQKGSYEEAFQKQKEMKESLEGWKKALREVGELKGWSVKDSTPQGELVKKVVSTVWGELKRNYSLVVNDCLVGIDDHVEEMMKLLSVNSDDVRVVGIHGMGGIGKTTIAKFIYNQLSQHFQPHCCFLEDVRATAQQQNGLVHLQKQLISDILKLRSPNLIRNKDEGINAIRDRFSGKKVLVVVDDADHRDQLHALAFVGKCDWFGLGSRIIVTTRNKEILNLPEVDCRTYEPKELDSARSLLLFSRHAFRKDHPPEGYVNLSKDVVSTTEGLPLALEIIGSFLSGKGKEVWEGTLKKLEVIPNKDVQDKLKISYTALEYDQQLIFLDIACFLIGVDRRIAFHMWDDCKFYPENGIEVLINMSLVKIGDNNELRMHDQLRDLGRDIVRQENFEEPEKRSRVWFHEEAIDVLERHTGTTKVKAICLNLKSESQVEALCLTNEEFANLSNLRFLQMDFAKLDGDFKGLLLNLRWLCWKGCPEIFSPTNFHLKNLVILDLSQSKVTEDWEGWNYIKIAKKLKVLNLTGCINMGTGERRFLPLILKLNFFPPRRIANVIVCQCRSHPLGARHPRRHTSGWVRL